MAQTNIFNAWTWQISHGQKPTAAAFQNPNPENQAKQLLQDRNEEATVWRLGQDTETCLNHEILIDWDYRDP